MPALGRADKRVDLGQALAGVTMVVGIIAVLVLYAEGYRMLQARILLGLFTAIVFFSVPRSPSPCL